ncbi:MAG TPA: tRNA (adenosine(37)-N6)-threonylcarbamoyltransferase complex ATPase subunit type 1 TsaE [Candidatus Heimdallarchaeota archaeon]|nr:tRNA (adenosine(37)-N6)-threonylcarbamoyltransferase complex ATPase subunit type 1 TsaE [Candidatus Heimdallarchaeota archaeon]
MDKTIIAHSAAEMEEIGVGLSPELSDGMVVSVIGPLGVGKTTLVKGIAKGLLITAVVVSPSYLLAREYHGRLTLHHLDAYRLETLSELAEVGLDQLLPPEDGVTIVEWPDRIDGILDISDILVRIALLEGSSRKVQIT